MAFTETQDLSNLQNKELLFNNKHTIYSRTHNISKENSIIETETSFVSNLKEMIEVHLLVNGFDAFNWNTLEINKKTTIYWVLQELLINMKKHRKYSLVVLTFKKNKKKLQIDYSDNGLEANFNKKKQKMGFKIWKTVFWI